MYIRDGMIYTVYIDMSTDRDSTVQFIIILVIPPHSQYVQRNYTNLKISTKLHRKTGYTVLPAGCIEPVAVLQRKRYKEIKEE